MLLGARRRHPVIYFHGPQPCAGIIENPIFRDFPVAMRALTCSKRTAPKESPGRRPSEGKKRTPLQPQCVLGMEPKPETKLEKGLWSSFPAFETTGLTSPNALWLQRRAFLGPIGQGKRRRSRRPPESKKGTPLQPQCVWEPEPGPKTVGVGVEGTPPFSLVFLRPFLGGGAGKTP